MEYDWRFNRPGRHLRVHMETWRQAEKHFDATLRLRRRPITTGHLSRVLLRYPLMTMQVSAAIYWQAFRLWRRGAPFFPHPRYRSDSEVIP